MPVRASQPQGPVTTDIRALKSAELAGPQGSVTADSTIAGTCSDPLAQFPEEDRGQAWRKVRNAAGTIRARCTSGRAKQTAVEGEEEIMRLRPLAETLANARIIASGLSNTAPPPAPGSQAGETGMQ